MNIVFDLEEWTDMQGNTGPYLMMAYTDINLYVPMAMMGIAVMQVQVAGLITRHPAPRTDRDTEEISREIERQLERLLSV